MASEVKATKMSPFSKPWDAASALNYIEECCKLHQAVYDRDSVFLDGYDLRFSVTIKTTSNPQFVITNLELGPNVVIKET
jgi:hypothetical protein